MFTATYSRRGRIEDAETTSFELPDALDDVRVFVADQLRTLDASGYFAVRGVHIGMSYDLTGTLDAVRRGT